MHDTAGEEDTEVGTDLAPVLDRLTGSGGRVELLRDFARAVLRRLPASQIAIADPVATAAAVKDSFGFVDARPPDAVAGPDLRP